MYGIIFAPIDFNEPEHNLLRDMLFTKVKFNILISNNYTNAILKYFLQDNILPIEL